MSERETAVERDSERESGREENSARYREWCVLNFGDIAFEALIRLFGCWGAHEIRVEREAMVKGEDRVEALEGWKRGHPKKYGEIVDKKVVVEGRVGEVSTEEGKKEKRRQYQKELMRKRRALARGEG